MAVDNAVLAESAGAPGQPAKWRLGGALWLLGMPGVVAVVWALLPPLKANEALLPLPLWAVVLLSGLQTAVLLALAVAVGVWLAPRVGLRAPVDVFLAESASPSAPRCVPSPCLASLGGVAGCRVAVGAVPGGARSAPAVGPGQRHAAGGQAAVRRHHRRAAGALGRDDAVAVAGLARGAARAGPAGQGAGGWRGAAQCAAVCAGAPACRTGAWRAH